MRSKLAARHRDWTAGHTDRKNPFLSFFIFFSRSDVGHVRSDIGPRHTSNQTCKMSELPRSHISHIPLKHVKYLISQDQTSENARSRNPPITVLIAAGKNIWVKPVQNLPLERWQDKSEPPSGGCLPRHPKMASGPSRASRIMAVTRRVKWASRRMPGSLCIFATL